MTGYERNAIADLLAQFGYQLVGQEENKNHNRRADAWQRGDLADHVRIEYRLTEKEQDR